jgi:LuxR family maltose regulon positive regulatory protein
MATSILVTKLYIPSTRTNLVHRPDLIKRLNNGLNRKLALISAPAGFGKTTLVSAWVDSLRQDTPENNQDKIKIAWLSLDEGDNDQTRFLIYLISALRTIEENIVIGVLSTLQSPQPPPYESTLTRMINEIVAIHGCMILVLDDYHLIKEQSVHDALIYLLENQPPNFHLVIATREDPPLQLARLRARDQLSELRANDLRFTSAEAAEFLNQVMGLNLSEEDIAALETRTEGWIAGLHLAAISMQRLEDTSKFIESFTGSHRLVVDYLIDEVLNQLPESVQTFLLQTAVLNRMNGSLCNALTGQENGQVILEMLEHNNLFIIHLDDERRWYRYHHLFADLLRRRLSQTYPKQSSFLHKRASDWYEQNRFIDEAIEHALHGEAFEKAAELIEDQFVDKYERGSHTILRRWMAELPQELIFARPHLCILYAWNLFTSGQLDAADRSLQVVENLLEKNQLTETDKRTLLGRASTIWAFIASYSGDMTGTIQYARRALDNLSEVELTWRSVASVALGDAFMNQGDMQAAYEARSEALIMTRSTGYAYLHLIANLRLAETLRQQGMLQQVIDICEQQMQRAKKSGISDSVVAGWLLAIWGEVLAELNDLDGANEKAKKGVELTEAGKDVAMVGWSNLCLVRVLFSRGDLVDAEEVIQKVEKIASEHDMPIWIPVQMSAWQIRLWLEQDKLITATRWVEERGLDIDGDLSYLYELEYLALARTLIVQEEYQEASRLLQRLLEAAEIGGHRSRVIEILNLQALSLQKQGDMDQAIATLEKSLTLAEPRGFIRIFVDEGPPMAHLLYEALHRGIEPEYVQQLLAAFSVDEPEQIAPPQTTETELIEPLSDRELEVLKLLAKGLTNREIADRLYISLNTAKVHVRNINSKLGTNSRSKTVIRARSLGILPTT